VREAFVDGHWRWLVTEVCRLTTAHHLQGAARSENLPGDGPMCQPCEARWPRPDWCMRLLGGAVRGGAEAAGRGRGRPWQARAVGLVVVTFAQSGKWPPPGPALRRASTPRARRRSNAERGVAREAALPSSKQHPAPNWPHPPQLLLITSPETAVIVSAT
jgi:hypothetical protein